jgi:hypothetical protein
VRAPVLALLVGTSVLLSTPVARGQEGCGDPATASARACEGLRAASEDRWADAEASLETALTFVDDPAIDARRAELEAALDEARARLGSLDVRCAPPGAVISIDGSARGLSPLARPLRLVPGRYLAGCALDGHAPASSSVDVTPGALAVATLTLAPIDRRPILERVGAPGEAQRVVGITALSLGGASLAVGLGALFAGLDAAPPGREPLFDVSRVTLIAGGALLVLGLVLVLTA